MENTNPITNQLVPEEQRLAVIEKIFGIHFPLAIEPAIYAFADRLSPDYHGAYWNFYTLDNGGFFWHTTISQFPRSEHIRCSVCRTP